MKGRRFAYLVEFADTANLVAVEAGAVGFGVKSGQLYHKSPAGAESMLLHGGLVSDNYIPLKTAGWGNSLLSNVGNTIVLSGSALDANLDLVISNPKATSASRSRVLFRNGVNPTEEFRHIFHDADFRMVYFDGTSGNNVFSVKNPLKTDPTITIGWLSNQGAGFELYHGSHTTRSGGFRAIYQDHFSVMQYNGSSWIPAFYVNSDRNFGVATETPTERLHVNGNFRLDNGNIGINAAPESTTRLYGKQGDSYLRLLDYATQEYATFDFLSKDEDAQYGGNAQFYISAEEGISLTKGLSARFLVHRNNSGDVIYSFSNVPEQTAYDRVAVLNSGGVLGYVAKSTFVSKWTDNTYGIHNNGYVSIGAGASGLRKFEVWGGIKNEPVGFFYKTGTITENHTVADFIIGRNINGNNAYSASNTVFHLFDEVTNPNVAATGAVFKATVDQTDRVVFNPRVAANSGNAAYYFDTVNTKTRDQLFQVLTGGASRFSILFDGAIRTGAAANVRIKFIEISAIQATPGITHELIVEINGAEYKLFAEQIK